MPVRHHSLQGRGPPPATRERTLLETRRGGGICRQLGVHPNRTPPRLTARFCSTATRGPVTVERLSGNGVARMVKRRAGAPVSLPSCSAGTRSALRFRYYGRPDGRCGAQDHAPGPVDDQPGDAGLHPGGRVVRGQPVGEVGAVETQGSWKYGGQSSGEPFEQDDREQVRLQPYLGAATETLRHLPVACTTEMAIS
jgi:hypothetical protein